MTEEDVKATEIVQRKVRCGLEYYFPAVHPSWRPTLRDERRLAISEALAPPQRNATSKKKDDPDCAAQLAKALLITTLEEAAQGNSA